MKKILLAFSLCGILGAFAQTIPNGSFENWTTTNYAILGNYNFQSSNMQSMQRIGMATVTQTADPYNGSFAVNMQTKTNGVDTMFGFFVNGMPCGPGKPNPGGIPYSSQPTGFTGHFKCNVMPGDTALLFVIFKKNAIVLSNGFYLKKFTGTQLSYASFNFPIALATAPDSVIIGAVSSNVIASGNGKPGSMLQLDSINFKGASNPANMNGSFENWSTGNYNTLNSWQTQGDSVSRSTSAFVGTYALLLQVTHNKGGCGSSSSPASSDQVTTGKFTNYGPPKGGRPYTLQNDSLIGYYKFAPVANDTAFISWGASKLGSPLGGNWKQIIGSTGGIYKRFSVPINLGSAPDSLRIDINAGKWPLTAGQIGSKLWVDGLYLLSSPLSVPLIFMGADYISTYPNPSKGIFNLVYDSQIDAPVYLQIFNETGQLVASQQLQNKGAKNQIDISTLNKGLYLLKTIQDNKVCTKRVIIE